jgi:hypothetical protein
MRTILAGLGLLLLGACALPMQNRASSNDQANLQRFVEPTGGAAYSQADARYYESGVNPGYAGPAAPQTFHH